MIKGLQGDMTQDAGYPSLQQHIEEVITLLVHSLYTGVIQFMV